MECLGLSHKYLIALVGGGGGLFVHYFALVGGGGGLVSDSFALVGGSRGLVGHPLAFFLVADVETDPPTDKG